MAAGMQGNLGRLCNLQPTQHFCYVFVTVLLDELPALAHTA